MKTRTHPSLLGAFALLCASCGGERAPRPAEPAPAGPGPAEVSPPREAPSGKELPRAGDPRFVRVVWHDGDDERELWLDPTLLADHRPQEAPPAQAAELLAGARERGAPSPGARLFELPPGALDAERLAADLRAARRYSPVFRDAPSDAGALWSLPGGVIVAFAEGWSAEQAEAWLRGRGLAVERALALGHPAFVVASDPGLPALELAEALRGSPELRSAQPDWWRPVQPR